MVSVSKSSLLFSPFLSPAPDDEGAEKEYWGDDPEPEGSRDRDDEFHDGKDGQAGDLSVDNIIDRIYFRGDPGPFFRLRIQVPELEIFFGSVDLGFVVGESNGDGPRVVVVVELILLRL